MKFIYAAALAFSVAVYSGAATAQDKPVVTEALKSALAVGEGQELLVKHYNVPPGWASPAHSHGGHMVLYVESGVGIMELESGELRGEAGQAIQASPGEAMVMRNGSDTEPLTFVVLQVSETGKAYITPIK